MTHLEIDGVNTSPLCAAKLALAVISSAHDEAGSAVTPSPVTAQDVDADYIIHQGLAALWARALTKSATDADAVGMRASSALNSANTRAVAMYMLQSRVLAEALRILNFAEVKCAVFKGGHIREWLYSDPSVRAAADVDVLVSAGDRLKAVNCLMDAGFALSVEAGFVSHEATLTLHGVDIDLHWHVTRPGRLRLDITHELLNRRRRKGDLWTLSDTDEVFLMLMHPAFTKYVSSPNMRLIRVVDFLFLLRDREVDWDAVEMMFERCGVKAAGWCVLMWYQMLHPLAMQVPATFVKRLAPGRIRSAYLLWWLRNDLPTRLFVRPLFIQIGMTLFFHDSVGDVWRVLTSIVRARRRGASDELVTLAQHERSGRAHVHAEK